MSRPRLYCIPHLRFTGDWPSGRTTKVQVIRQDYEPTLHRAIKKAKQQTDNGYPSWVERHHVPATGPQEPVVYGNRGFKKS